MITYRNDLSVTPGGKPLRIRLNQRDANFRLIFDLYSTVGKFTMQSGSSVKMTGRFQDGTSFTANGTYSGTTVTVNGTSDMTAGRGDAIAELTITRNGKQLSTANFILSIERKP